MSALSGFRVIELASERISWAGKLLGDMGADVILVEPPAGDPSRRYPPFAGGDSTDSLYFRHYNTSKRSVVLDLDDPEADWVSVPQPFERRALAVASEPISIAPVRFATSGASMAWS